eukprot:13663494-Alexandrium_andersonii.AAC.1
MSASLVGSEMCIRDRGSCVEAGLLGGQLEGPRSVPARADQTVHVHQTAEIFDDHEHPGIVFPACRGDT